MANIKIGKDIQQNRITVSFPYNPKFVAMVKSVEGHRWHPDKKYWSFPHMEEGNLIENGLYHEIYLSDPRRVLEENWRTILRQPVKERG